LAATTTTPESAVITPPWLRGKFRSVVMGSLERAQQPARSNSNWTTGKRLKEVDSALPGKHVKLLYDTLTRTEAQALAQLRTGHSKLRGFLARVGAEETDQCECGQGKEVLNGCCPSSDTGLSVDTLLRPHLLGVTLIQV
jgi:hypothetical protein